MLLDAFRKQLQTLDRGLALFEPPVLPKRIPFEQGSMPAYLVPAARREREVRPVLIFTNGYDATITDMYFASAVAASRRGYHCLLFDGPGQGEMLYEHSIHIRPDWEAVIAAVVDFVVAQPNIDPGRIALSGWSLGGQPFSTGRVEDCICTFLVAPTILASPMSCGGPARLRSGSATGILGSVVGLIQSTTAICKSCTFLYGFPTGLDPASC